jgi:Sodium/hydrogen exchanger family
MTTNQILFGLGLVLILAVSSQLLARPLRAPALVVLLPAGFLAGIATDNVHPDNLLGSLYQPFVTIAVGVILFEAGLRLSFEEVVPRVRKTVVRLVAGGALLTWLATTAAVALLYDDMDRGAAFLIGAILVVSGPTVVLPLLAFIRPTRDVRSLEQKDPLARRREVTGEGAAARARADDDDVVGIHRQYSSSISGTMIRAAASNSARWENACGKLPRCLPVSASNSSA